MDLRIRTIDFTAAGREIVRERELSADAITIGRSPANAIHLTDLALEQEHVRITPTPDGHLRLEALGTLGFALDGRNVTSASVDPARGDELRVGSYRIGISREPDGRVAFTVREVVQDSGAARERLRGFGLGDVLPGKRTMSWVLAGAILVAFLAIPIISNLMRPDVPPHLDGQGAVVMDASWSTGPLSLAHHGLEDSCESCHVVPFEPVQDATCISCHEDIGDHAEAQRIDAGRPGFSAGDAVLWGVAHAFGKPGPGACSDCHTEHEGAGAMEPVHQQFCADCHGTLDQRLTDTSLGNAADFGEVHPEFKALVLPAEGAQEPQRVSLEAKPHDFPGLRFPHEVHLDPTSGVAQMATRLGSRAGYGGPLQCSSCHRPTSDGVRFQPIDMERDCESCHSLVYDKVGNTYRTLRHGDVAQVEADLVAADRSPRDPITTGRRRPGQFAEGGLYYGNFSLIPAAVLRARAMEENGLCGDCHLRGDPGIGPLSVAPVKIRERFFQHGWFDHEQHKQEDCTTCHAAHTSQASSDLLLPGIGICRDCHLGEAAKEAEVPSSCAMCHSYHPHELGEAARIALEGG